MNRNIKISKLDPTAQELIQKIANWYFNEWNTPIEKTISRLSNQPGHDTIFQLVLALENEVVATGGLCNTVNIYHVHPKLKAYKPWVALLYTQEDYRNRGYGELLLNQIEDSAKEIGLTKIYLYTFTAESLYRRCGWREIDRVSYKGHDTVVMEKKLNERDLQNRKNKEDNSCQ
jgi:GNAT superfamily N-acetyltransferase